MYVLRRRLSAGGLIAIHPALIRIIAEQTLDLLSEQLPVTREHIMRIANERSKRYGRLRGRIQRGVQLMGRLRQYRRRWHGITITDQELAAAKRLSQMAIETGDHEADQLIRRWVLYSR